MTPIDCGHLEGAKGTAFVNLFESDFRVHSMVCVVAPGPNVREHYHRIPDEFQIVVGSKAEPAPELHRAHERANCPHCHWFEPKQSDLFAVPSPPVGRPIRYRAKVTPCALQLAYGFGASEVLPCGAGMSGNAYFDDQLNPQPCHGDRWPPADRIAYLVRRLETASAFRVRTLSPTRRAVPKYSPA